MGSYITEVREPEMIKAVDNRKITPTDIPDNNRIKESMDFAEKHKTILEQVKSILRYDKLARKDYWWLQAILYSKCGFIKEIAVLERFRNKPSPESISRCRRELYKMARKGDPDLRWLLDDKKFIEEMKNEEELYRDYYSQQNYIEKSKIVK